MHANTPNAVEVTVEITGQTLTAGTLWTHTRGTQSATFRYADSYLSDRRSYDLDPMLPRTSDVFQTPIGKPMFNCFADCAPDRWGRNLMRREERERARSASTTPRTLLESDFLLGVHDLIRQGALRFRSQESEDYFSSHDGAVPKIVDLGRLLTAVDRLDAGAPQDRDIRDLINAGGSLGGARPKAAVITHDGHLAMAKFPRKGSDDWDVIGWEKLEIDLAERSGISVAKSELIRSGKRNILLIRRFDRTPGERIGFLSALTLLEASDGDRRSYLEIADAVERHSDRVNADLEQLFRRIAFSILTGNTDDHLRNHGFLRSTTGWVLSPAYDLNPNPDNPSHLTTAIDLDDTTASVDTALSVAKYFRLSLDAAKTVFIEIERSTRDWRAYAKSLSLAGNDIDLMSVAFDSEQRRVAHQLFSTIA